MSAGTSGTRNIGLCNEHEFTMQRRQQVYEIKGSMLTARLDAALGAAGPHCSNPYTCLQQGVPSHLRMRRFQPRLR